MKIPIARATLLRHKFAREVCVLHRYSHTLLSSLKFFALTRSVPRCEHTSKRTKGGRGGDLIYEPRVKIFLGHRLIKATTNVTPYLEQVDLRGIFRMIDSIDRPQILDEK